MSKEIQCKCCKEYWWEMNIHSKSGLCPNCYDYVSDLEAKLAESNESHHKNIVELTKIATEKDRKIEKLKQQLAEKKKKIADLQSQLQQANEIINNPDTLIFQQQQLIDNLKSQLAEKEERIKWLVESEWNRKWANKYVEMRRKGEPKLLFPDSDEVYQRYFELKQQLEEKEKEIKNLVLAHFENEINKPVLTTTQMINQDKISFALEQLEKVKSVINASVRDDHIVWDFDIKAHIDNQIKQLKEMMKSE